MSGGGRVLYTAVFGGYDYAPAPRGQPAGVPRLCFTDRPADVPSGWTPVETRPTELDPAMANRHLKLFPHRQLAAYDTSLYVDANVALRADPWPLVARYLRDAAIAIPRHPLRDCVYDEAQACIVEGRAPAAETAALMERYRQEGLPRNLGLSENFLVARRHHDPSAIRLAELWWAALERGPRRDQFHLPYLAWRHQIPLRTMEESAHELRGLLRRLPHRPRHGRLQRAYYRTLARHFANPLGRLLEGGVAAYNRAKRVDL